MKTIKLNNHFKANQADKFKGKFLNENDFDTLITEDCDGFDMYGNLLFRYRKNALPTETLLLGYNSFKESLLRGVA